MVKFINKQTIWFGGGHTYARAHAEDTGQCLGVFWPSVVWVPRIQLWSLGLVIKLLYFAGHSLKDDGPWASDRGRPLPTSIPFPTLVVVHEALHASASRNTPTTCWQREPPITPWFSVRFWLVLCAPKEPDRIFGRACTSCSPESPLGGEGRQSVPDEGLRVLSTALLASQTLRIPLGQSFQTGVLSF